MVSATLNFHAQTKLKTRDMSLLSLGEQLEYVHTRLVRRGDNPIKETLINIPKLKWSYPHQDLQKNGLK